MKNYSRKKPFILCILDGLGVAPPGPGNAVTLSKTENLDKFWFSYPHCYLHASGSAVGLPSGTNGNSEVGHINIGAGKVVFQELPRIDNSIINRTFFQNQVIQFAIRNAIEKKTKFHIIGLISNGKVHSSIDHVFALIEFTKKMGIQKNQLFIHAFTDGRDSPPTSAKSFIEEIDSECQRNGVGQIASIIGRFFAMDRDKRWERTKKAYELLTQGAGKKFKNWTDAINDAYSNNETDEYIEPRVITNNNGDPIATIQNGDSVLFINFRPDRAIQLSKAFVEDSFQKWQREKLDITFVGMNEYEKGIPKLSAFPPEYIAVPIGRVIADSGLRQLRIAESEKFPHVTYFINGGNDIIYNGEDRIEVPSPKDVTTYDQKPQMSAFELTDILIEKIKSQIYDFIIVNYANADMVAHTGIIEATIKAVQFIDNCLGKLSQTVLMYDGAMVITADHGNAEELINLQTGKIDTEHSTNPVPFIYIANDVNSRELSLGILADISPTILNLLGIEKPSTMTGRNLLL